MTPVKKCYRVVLDGTLVGPVCDRESDCEEYKRFCRATFRGAEVSHIEWVEDAFTEDARLEARVKHSMLWEDEEDRP